MGKKPKINPQSHKPSPKYLNQIVCRHYDNRKINRKNRTKKPETKKKTQIPFPKFTNVAGAYVRMMFEQLLAVTQSMCCLLCFQKYAVKYADKYSEQKQQKQVVTKRIGIVGCCSKCLCSLCMYEYSL